MLFWKKRRFVQAEKFIQTEDEWDEILRRFREEGVDSNLPDEHRLLYVWRWLVDAETNCISLRHQLDKISRRQSSELEEIHNCMEQMCNAWEAKVSKLEEENKKFLEQLNFGSDGPRRVVSQEINQMCIDEGLAEITDLSIVEQFAFLLDLKNRLKAKCDQELAMRRKCEQLVRMSPNLPDCLKLSSPYIQRILDRQKDEYEEEIRHQQEAMKHVKEQLKQVHEDELQRLSAENDTLNSELSSLSQKLQELVTEASKKQDKSTSSLPWVQHILNGTHEKEMKLMKTEVEQLKSLCQDQQSQIREQGEALRILERTNKQLELDNETLAFKLSESLAQFDELEDQLRRDTRVRREPLYKVGIKDFNFKNQNKLLDNRPNTLDPIYEDQVKQLKDEAGTLKEQLEAVQQQYEIMSMKYQQQRERYRVKMYQLRDLQEQEHREWTDRFANCDQELALLRDILAQEQKSRSQAESKCQRLQSDGEKLRSGLSEKGKVEQQYNVPADSDQSKLAVASNSSPLKRHSVWPTTSQPKMW